MDRIEALDWAVYSHFAYQIASSPGLVTFMQIAYVASGYVGTTFLMLYAATLFVLQRKIRSALVVVVSFAAAVALIHAARWAVPRPRPEEAIRWIEPDNMIGSYPAPGVFLFMLDMILIGFAIWQLAPRVWQRGLYILAATGLTVWVCMSQFVLPIHFLTDAFGGMAGATLIGWIAYHFLDRAPRTQQDSNAPATKA